MVDCISLDPRDSFNILLDIMHDVNKCILWYIHLFSYAIVSLCQYLIWCFKTYCLRRSTKNDRVKVNLVCKLHKTFDALRFQEFGDLLSYLLHILMVVSIDDIRIYGARQHPNVFIQFLYKVIILFTVTIIWCKIKHFFICAPPSLYLQYKHEWWYMGK